MSQSIVKSVKSRIYGHGKGWVFTAYSFADLGSDSGVRTALSRLQKEKIIRRIAQGIYDYPKSHKVLGAMSPSVEAVANAYAEKNGAKIQASGAYAANVLGLSEQVPGKVIFLTDGPTGRIKIKNLVVSFKKTTVRNMHAAGSKEALVIQAFKFMKQNNITDTMLEKARKLVKQSKRKEFEKNIQYAPRWIRMLLINLMMGDL